MSVSDTPPLLLKNVAGITVATLTAPKIGQDARDALFELIDKHEVKKMVLNFQNLQVLSSGPIGTLVNLGNKLHSVGGSLTLCLLSPDIREILKLTRVEGLFSIFDNEQAAIDSLTAE
jgi:anti-sigma B factor antagonist